MCIPQRSRSSSIHTTRQHTSFIAGAKIGVMVLLAFVALGGGALFAGGGGDGDGIDILPSWLVHWLEDHPEVDVCTLVAEIQGGEHGRDGSSVDIRGAGGDINLRVTFGPEGDVGAGATLPTILVSGTIDGNPVLECGYAATTQDGKLKLYGKDLSGGMVLTEPDPDPDSWGYTYWLYIELCPEEFGDGNPLDDPCGFIDSAMGGLLGVPHGRRLATH